MAGVELETGGFTAVAIQTTARSMLTILAGSAQPIECVDWWVDFDSAAAAAGIFVELCLISTTGTGTSLTPRYIDGRVSTPTFAGTAKYNCTVEPTVTYVLRQHLIAPTSGRELWVPDRSEFIADVSTGFAIRVTGQSGNVPKCTPGMRIRI